MTDAEFKQFDRHFPAKVSPAIVEYATDVVFLHSRYLFTRREGKQQLSYCTHCRTESPTQGLRAGHYASCPTCGSECFVKSAARGRSHMVDEAYFVYYEKSRVNPKAITARGIYAVRDYRKDFHAVETLFTVKAMYLFEAAGGTMYERQWMWYGEDCTMHMGENWTRRKTVGSMMSGVMMHKPCYCSHASVQRAVKDTPFQYSTWDRYTDERDWTKFFDLAAKYPCVEYLTKLGFQALVEAKLHGGHTYGLVNWRGKTPPDVLRMSRQEMKQLQLADVKVDPWLLYLRKLSQKDGSNLTFAELGLIREDIHQGYRTDLESAAAHTNLRRLYAYLTKQFRRPGANKYYYSITRVLSDWNDYLRDCARLELDTESEAILFPSNLRRAHQNTIKQIKVKADEALREEITARVRALQKFRFAAQGLFLRPAESAQELIDEGKALHHCVGTYAERYAKGETDLLVIRQVESPDKPFYTMEVQRGRVVQCRGKNNCNMTPEVQEFVEAFKRQKLTVKQQRVKVREAV